MSDIPAPDLPPGYCSRSEAIELAISTMLWSHALVAIVSLVFAISQFGAPGVWIGLAMVALLLAIMPVVALPTAYLIGWLAHRLFSTSTIPVGAAIRMMSILFEVNLLG